MLQQSITKYIKVFNMATFIFALKNLKKFVIQF